MYNKKLRQLIEISLFATLAIILDRIPLFTLPQGGSVTLTMVPILLISFRHGIKTGLLNGAIVGTLQLFLGGYFLHPVQALLDYTLAYTLVGIAGLANHTIQETIVRSPKQNYIWISLASTLGAGLRLACHFLAGLIFYGSFAPEGTPVWQYSLIYNASHIIPSLLISLMTVILLYRFKPSFFKF